ncbi:MAG: hypothetical protein AMJ93_03705 [Anaerolineae bacterium SM23_84]|nr:MAG: hypothetical protein AMJ93_03705 [Anaerolineae bacterium SM23_84]
MPDFSIFVTIAEELGLHQDQVAHTAQLLDDGNTVPFIARYRKEATSGLDEEQIRNVQSRLSYLRNLAQRKETVLKSIAEQGKLTPELEAAIRVATTLQEVEDLYLPYKPKRRTRAMIAREKGLQPLADLLLTQEVTSGTLEEYAQPFLCEQVPSVEEAYAGARDIVAEVVSEDAATRRKLRLLTLERGLLLVSLDEEDADPENKYLLYHDHSEPLRDIPAHRLLAINRGEQEKALRVHLEVPEDEALYHIRARYLRNPDSIFVDQVEEALQDSYDRLIAPSIEREVRRLRTAQAQAHAIKVFATNLRHLLLQPPMRGVRVMGIDPGYRTGCKVALVDETGKFLGGTTIYPHEPKKQWDQALEALRALVTKAQVQVIAIGNGTASRETEKLVAELIDVGVEVSYAIISEAGASVYSASKLAREEFPDLDVSMRGAISIARRLQDPLAELVKIDPQSIGVGLYQHDVEQKALREALDAVVESVVNYVGVDVNTASVALLQHVAGLNARAAQGLVKRREQEGPFTSRAGVLEVRGLGPKAFQQAAGFLRLPDALNPLDRTAIHPESYPVVERLFTLMGVQGNEPDLAERVRAFRAVHRLEDLAAVLEVGMLTLMDILEDLVRPGRDPRDSLPGPVLRRDVLSIDDLREGMVLTGIVRNVVDFGAFVDIGVKQDGLVHVSEMGKKYVRDPYTVLSVGDIVQVRVIHIDKERGRIGLSMKKAADSAARALGDES